MAFNIKYDKSYALKRIEEISFDYDVQLSKEEQRCALKMLTDLYKKAKYEEKSLFENNVGLYGKYKEDLVCYPFERAAAEYIGIAAYFVYVSRKQNINVKLDKGYVSINGTHLIIDTFSNGRPLLNNRRVKDLKFASDEEVTDKVKLQSIDDEYYCD